MTHANSVSDTWENSENLAAMLERRIQESGCYNQNNPEWFALSTAIDYALKGPYAKDAGFVSRIMGSLERIRYVPICRTGKAPTTRIGRVFASPDCKIVLNLYSNCESRVAGSPEAWYVLDVILARHCTPMFSIASSAVGSKAPYVRLSPDCEKIAILFDNRVDIWSINDIRRVSSCCFELNGLVCAGWSGDSKKLILLSGDGSGISIDADSGSASDASYPLHSLDVCSSAQQAEGYLMIRPIPEFSESYGDVLVNHDGTKLVFLSGGGVFRADSGKSSPQPLGEYDESKPCVLIRGKDSVFMLNGHEAYRIDDSCSDTDSVLDDPMGVEKIADLDDSVEIDILAFLDVGSFARNPNNYCEKNQMPYDGKWLFSGVDRNGVVSLVRVNSLAHRRFSFDSIVEFARLKPPYFRLDVFEGCKLELKDVVDLDHALSVRDTMVVYRSLDGIRFRPVSLNRMILKSNDMRRASSLVTDTSMFDIRMCALDDDRMALAMFDDLNGVLRDNPRITIRIFDRGLQDSHVCDITRNVGSEHIDDEHKDDHMPASRISQLFAMHDGSDEFVIAEFITSKGHMICCRDTRTRRNPLGDYGFIDGTVVEHDDGRCLIKHGDGTLAAYDAKLRFVEKVNAENHKPEPWHGPGLPINRTTDMPFGKIVQNNGALFCLRKD